MILEIIAITLVILLIVLPFCMWPIFIAMAVNTSHKIIEDDGNEENIKTNQSAFLLANKN